MRQFLFLILISFAAAGCSKEYFENCYCTVAGQCDDNCDGVPDAGALFDPGAPAYYPVTSFVLVTSVSLSMAYTNGGAGQWCQFVPAGYAGQPGTISTQNLTISFQEILATGFLGTGGSAMIDQNLSNRMRIDQASANLATSVAVTVTSLLNRGRSAELRNYLNQAVIVAVLETGNAPGGVYGSANISQDQECLVAPFIYARIIGYEMKTVGELFKFQ